MGRHWVVDASPIILLAKTGHVDLLSACAEVLVPEAVAEEVEQASADDAARTWIEGKGRSVVEATEPVASEVAAWDLGRGENHVLSHGLRHDGWTAVIDDGAARRCVQSLDVPVIGTLGVLVVAKSVGRLEQVRPAINRLVQAGLHVDEAVIEHVLRMAGEN
jgi:predicted nucleic acid-binding protein